MESIAAWWQRRRERALECRRQGEVLPGPKAELPGGLRTWMQVSMQWMVDQFGTAALCRPVVLPSDFVPKDYDGSENAARALCLKVCDRMGVPTERLRVSFQTDGAMTVQGQDTAIVLPARLLPEPAAVVAAVAHELGHEVLDGRGLIDTQRPDAEAMAELYAVYQGFGVFLLNRSSEPAKGRPWLIETFGNLKEQGYAEALAAYWLRHRDLCPGQPVMPPWRKQVDWSARLLLSRRVQLMSERAAS
ncbi:hypothetical protein ACWGID_23350 [Kribbella sp. NPDC054772]